MRLWLPGFSQAAASVSADSWQGLHELGALRVTRRTAHMSAVPPSGRRVRFGEYILDGERRQVLDVGGTPLPLTPRLFNAIELFVARAGELVERDDLMQALWPGRVVEENSLSQVVHSLRRALGEDGEGRGYIQTEPRRGYRLVVPVNGTDAAIVGSGARTAQPHAGRTLAVLPFLAVAPQPALQALEVAMADSLIARLSALPGLVVRSVGSIRRFANPARDPAQVARLLAAVWILDGTLQLAGDRLRVSARLLSMPSGTAAWSGSLNVAFTDVFEIQDIVSERVAQAVAAPLGGRDA